MTAKLPGRIFYRASTSVKKDSASPSKFQSARCRPYASSPDSASFIQDHITFAAPAVKSSHWSVAWSDLMMTMFILFLSLFVYQSAQKDFFIGKGKEVIAGETINGSVSAPQEDKATFPFVVIKPAAPLVATGAIKKVESIPLQKIELNSALSNEDMEVIFGDNREEIFMDNSTGSGNTTPHMPPVLPQNTAPIDQVIQPLPLEFTQPEPAAASIGTLFNEGRKSLESHNLSNFAAINLIPDKAVRIVLTGDLLFETGQAVLSLQAIKSLEKIAAVIYTTEHQIHIEGHTDDVPIASEKYANNWELSLARANAVAAFMIHDMKMDPGKIVISGYSSYRPVSPNTSQANRTKNRRVEIIISTTKKSSSDLYSLNTNSTFSTP